MDRKSLISPTAQSAVDSDMFESAIGSPMHINPNDLLSSANQNAQPKMTNES